MKLDIHGRIINSRDKLEASLQFTPQLDKFVEECKKQLNQLEREKFNLLDLDLSSTVSKTELRIKELLLVKPGLTRQQISKELNIHRATVTRNLNNSPIIYYVRSRTGKQGNQFKRYYAKV